MGALLSGAGLSGRGEGQQGRGGLRPTGGVRHGDADVVRARLVSVEPGLDQPIILHSCERKCYPARNTQCPTRNMQRAARNAQRMLFSACDLLDSAALASLPVLKRMLRKEALWVRVLNFRETVAARCAMLRRVVHSVQRGASPL